MCVCGTKQCAKLACRDSCQGQLPWVAFLPPTTYSVNGDCSGFTPHSTMEKDHVTLCISFVSILYNPYFWRELRKDVSLLLENP